MGHLATERPYRLMIKLKYKNISLIEYTASDINSTLLKRYQLWMKSSKINKFLIKKESDKKSLKNFLEKMMESKKDIFFKIIFKKTHIGNLRLVISDYKTAGFGIMIGNYKFHNKKIGKICLYIILKYIFSKLKMNKIVLNVAIENLPALKLYKKFLMKENKKGKYIYFSMTRNFFFTKINKKLEKLINL